MWECEEQSTPRRRVASAPRRHVASAPRRRVASLDNLMHICLYNLTTTTQVGGVESFVWDLAHELTRRGLQVSIIGGTGSCRQVVHGARVLSYPFISRTRWRTLPPLRRLYGFAKLLERLSFAVAALPGLVALRPDIVHIQKPFDLAPALLARRLTGMKLVFGCHGKDFYLGDQLLGKRADIAVSCSRFNAETVAAHYGIMPRVVYNGVDFDLFRPVPPDAALRQRYAPAGEALLLFVGRLIPWKGVQYILQALTELPHTRVLIAGDGPYRAHLTWLAETFGVAARVTFLGSIPRTELPRLYASVDLVIGASFANETFGIALVEAQACGTPVVASAFGGFPEVVRPGETGLLVPPQHPSALAAGIRALLDDPARRSAMGQAGREWVTAQFSWASVTERVLAAYAEVM